MMTAPQDFSCFMWYSILRIVRFGKACYNISMKNVQTGADRTRIARDARTIVGRAELKLAEAAKAFGYDFRGKTVLDIGSSTGGFTEYALRQGAAKVIAVEKGTNQMAKPLRYDPKIVLLEKTDVFEVVMGKRRPGIQERWLAVSGRGGVAELKGVDTVLADVSFVSLRKVLAHVRDNIADKTTDFLVMLKPQFEAESKQLVNGVVKNEKMRREIAQNFERWLGQNGYYVVKKRDNELTGKNGNRERFYWLRLVR